MTTILAPLDGTQAGEAVLPHLVTLSFGYRAIVHLVLAAGAGPVPTEVEQRAALRPRPAVPAAEGAAYLEGAAQWLRQRGVTSSCAQPAAPPAGAMRRLVEQLGVDLLALSTAGWARLGTTALGALAEEVVRIAACPIVLLRVDVARSVRSEPPRARPYRRVVVALDGSPGAELVLPRVEPLARAFAAQLLLVRATIPPSAAPEGSEPGEANGAGASGRRLDPVARADAERYLAEAADRLQQGGLRTAPVSRVGPADAVILDCARTRGADLIAMATGRGPAPFGRLGLGRTTDAVVRHAPCPVLVVPESQAARPHLSS
ncbi:MAG TPA: universal stress protein [Chloroflexota bacterium]